MLSFSELTDRRVICVWMCCLRLVLEGQGGSEERISVTYLLWGVVLVLRFLSGRTWFAI